MLQRAGDKPIGALVDGDVVSAVEFDEKGEYLATGDRGGRVRIYLRAQVGPTVSQEHQLAFFAAAMSHLLICQRNPHPLRRLCSLTSAIPPSASRLPSFPLARLSLFLNPHRPTTFALQPCHSYLPRSLPRRLERAHVNHSARRLSAFLKT